MKRAIVILLSMLSLSLSMAVASAQEAKIPVVGASDCFSWAAPSELVASTTPGGAPNQSVQLRCGDFSQGVFHIDQGHPIAEDGSDDVNVNGCFNHIWSRP